ncbi:LOW QUALITY PROTEIN: phosphatidylserine lipase ABHD16A [Vespula maculifrons]|uniref:Phosphatidylserine lipase ABHD16A n=1 Tax=Vespula maculifrons TaxID=7453 RepID=A0ABD2CAG3_VESMC
MSLMKILFYYTFGPRLFKIYEVTTTGRLIDKSYEPKVLERWSDRFSAVWSISSYAFMSAAIFMYLHSYSVMDITYQISKFAASAGIILIASLAARGCSRANNANYSKFLKTLRNCHTNYNITTKQELCKYDFEFCSWPVEFAVTTLQGEKNRKKLRLEEIKSNNGIRVALSCIIAYTFAIKLIYPGSISVINWALHSVLLKGRIDLIKQGGERFKLVTCDGNVIDTMFIDQRKKTTNGDILVITCEGNCGFYETGIISTPLNKGYSVLGWNHPGFGGSTLFVHVKINILKLEYILYIVVVMARLLLRPTYSYMTNNIKLTTKGEPHPVQEENAIDCIMQFAKHQLMFPERKIILYGWSIGGYTATWAAMNYPSIHSLILDATFDDILPLAIMTMPLLKGIVQHVIRLHFNLNIAEQLNRYDGTVLLIRRTNDEIVCSPANILSGNRGNMLLTKLLLRRYPYLFSEDSDSLGVLNKFLSANVDTRRLIVEALEINEKHCSELITIENPENNEKISYPCNLGQDCDIKTKQQLTIFLATVYMKDQPSSHCTPLSVELFQPGWDPASAISM